MTWQPLTTTVFVSEESDKSEASNPCVAKEDCSFCKVLTSDQCAQLATPNYNLRRKNKN